MKTKVMGKREVVDRLLDLSKELTKAILDNDDKIVKILRDKINNLINIYLYDGSKINE